MVGIPRRGLVVRGMLGLLGLSSSFLTACAPPQIQGQSYQIVFIDEFDGTAVNPDIWATAPFGGSLPATVADGVLTLRTTAANDYRWAYLASTGPRVDAEPDYPFPRAWEEGYFEARIRYSDNRWSWPAFWLFSMAKTEAWPGENCFFANAEWDIMENGVDYGDGSRPASDWYYGSLHRNTTDNTEDGYCGQPDTQRTVSRDFSGTNLSGWHVWGGRWSDGEMCMYLDDVEIQCIATWDSTAQLMHLTFTMQYLGQCDGCPSRPASLQMQVDWVRVWQKS